MAHQRLPLGASGPDAACLNLSHVCTTQAAGAENKTLSEFRVNITNLLYYSLRQKGPSFLQKYNGQRLGCIINCPKQNITINNYSMIIKCGVFGGPGANPMKHRDHSCSSS